MTRNHQLGLFSLCFVLAVSRGVTSTEYLSDNSLPQETQLESDVGHHPSLEYGVDVSYPMHHYGHVSTNYPWLPHHHHNDNSSIVETPPEYVEQPIQPLGDRQKFYNDLLNDCVEYFNKNSNSNNNMGVERCHSGEQHRIEMSLRQPQSMKNFTALGFKKIKAPENIFKLLQIFWESNKMNPSVELWGVGDMTTNHWQVPSKRVNIYDPKLQGRNDSLQRQIWDAAREIIQGWTGQQLEPSSMYGIRVYYGGAILAPHVDRLPLVSSAIINVDQDVDEPWPLEVIGHDGRAHNVTMKPGDMVLYESHSVLHGRPFPMKGRFVANLFIHFAPVEAISSQQDGDARSAAEGRSRAKKQSNLPKYILPGSPEANRLQTGSPTLASRGTSTIAHRAAKLNHLDALQKAIGQNRDLLHARDEKGWTPLHEAARFGYVDVVKYLLAQGADINSRTRNHDGASVLWWAETYAGKDHPVVELLKSQGATIMTAEL